MKINWEMVISVAIAMVLVTLLDKFVLSNIGNYDADAFGSYDELDY